MIELVNVQCTIQITIQIKIPTPIPNTNTVNTQIKRHWNQIQNTDIIPMETIILNIVHRMHLNSNITEYK